MHWYSKTRNISVLSKREIRLSKKVASNCLFVIKVEFDVKFGTSDTFVCKTKNIAELPIK